MDADHCYRVASSRDGRFDGTFVTAVLTTGIYCRPSCPAVTPKRENARFYPTPAAAQDAGFRACKRCRPDAAPGSPEWDSRADLVARAVRLIGDGVVERDGVGGLSRRLGYSPRQLHRLVAAELGTGPLRLAMAHRVQGARALLENTDLPVTAVAWAAGFGSIRQFNDQMRQVFALTPSEIRARRPADGQRAATGGGHTVTAHLSYRPPLDLDGLLGFLGARAVPGIEAWDGDTYTRVLDLPHGGGLARLARSAAGDRADGRGKARSHPVLTCHFELDDIRDYATAVSRMRRLLDLDADPTAVGRVLGDDPSLAPLVAASPGRRMPGTVSPFEMAVRAVVGQHVSVASSTAACGRLTARWGRPLETCADAGGGAWRTFPRPEDLAGADPGAMAIPARRAATVVALARAVVEGRITLDPGADRDETERRLLELPGVGPWTAAYVKMRALGDPDVFLPGDVGLEKARSALRAEPGPHAAAWKPWRSYAVAHLWAAGHSPSGHASSRERQPR